MANEEEKNETKKNGLNRHHTTNFTNFTSLRYIDEFIGLDCAADLISHQLFPDSKEITECMALYNAYRRHLLPILEEHPTSGKCVILSIGDGCTPRTSALFAYLTKNWETISIGIQLCLNFLAE